MIPTFTNRLVLSLVFIAVFASVVKALGAFNRWRARTRSGASRLPAVTRADQPTLLYFWSAGCAQCTPQERQLEQVKETLLQTGVDVKILKVNALEDRRLAQSMQVMTVPTTVLLDQRGNVAAWNPGLTPWRKLVHQYHMLS